jgi:hypothetical protein
VFPSPLSGAPALPHAATRPHAPASARSDANPRAGPRDVAPTAGTRNEAKGRFTAAFCRRKAQACVESP